MSRGHKKGLQSMDVEDPTQEKQGTVATRERPETQAEGQCSGCSPHEQDVCCIIIGIYSACDGSSTGFPVVVYKYGMLDETSEAHKLSTAQCHDKAPCVCSVPIENTALFRNRTASSRTCCPVLEPDNDYCYVYPTLNRKS